MLASNTVSSDISVADAYVKESRDQPDVPHRRSFSGGLSREDDRVYPSDFGIYVRGFLRLVVPIPLASLNLLVLVLTLS